jgi:asparagine synthase (glutamine-hydrolysing)
LRGLQTKYLVKKLGESMLPHEAIHRPKVGFGVPVVDWLRDPAGLGRYFELFSEPRFAQRGYLRPGRVRQLVDQHVAGTHNHCEVLWNLINLELWYRIFIEKSWDPS